MFYQSHHMKLQDHQQNLLHIYSLPSIHQSQNLSYIRKHMYQDSRYSAFHMWDDLGFFNTRTDTVILPFLSF